MRREVERDAYAYKGKLRVCSVAALLLLGGEVAGGHARERRAVGLEHRAEAQVRQCEGLVPGKC